MVRNDEQRRRFGERLISGQEPGIDMTVRANERQPPRFLVNLASRLAYGGVGVEEPVVVELELSRSVRDRNSSDRS
jgi:hypothetical protein